MLTDEHQGSSLGRTRILREPRSVAKSDKQKHSLDEIIQLVSK